MDAQMWKRPWREKGPVIGSKIVEILLESMTLVRKERFAFIVAQKQGHTGSMNDVFTSADKHAQDLLVKLLTEAFPGVGILAEEGGLKVKCTIEGIDVYFTIDPIDGTRAFIRRQSHGVGVMIALVVDGTIISAWVGDINTMEIYGYRPGTRKVYRMSDLETSEHLNIIPRSTMPSSQYLLLRDPQHDVDNLSVQRAIKAFKNYSIDGGSIGIWMARLWKGEVGGGLLDPCVETPWDATPIIGISRKLGFVFLRPYGGKWKPFNPPIRKTVYTRKYPVLVVHQNMVHNFT